MVEFGKWVIIGLIFVSVVGYVVERGAPFDATDAPGKVSGLKLRTDYGTGCQYLETSDGGVTPRLGPDGRQVCGVHH